MPELSSASPSPPASPSLGALREVPYMGVIFVVAEAMKLGFTNGHPDWCNLGQGNVCWVIVVHVDLFEHNVSL